MTENGNLYPTDNQHNFAPIVMPTDGSEQPDMNGMAELLNIQDGDDFPVSGRVLHKRLRIETPYRKWFPRMCEYGFEEGKDFYSKMSESTGGRPSTDHYLTIEMAKHLCMIQRNAVGRMVRDYLIDVENAWNSPDAIMDRALKISSQRMRELAGQVLHLQAENNNLTVQTQIMKPKADYFDELVDRNLLTNLRETAKQFHVKEREFVTFLVAHGYLYRDKRGKLMPTAKKNDGLFEVKECFNDKTQWSGTQTLVTPKGRETFRLLTQGLVSA